MVIKTGQENLKYIHEQKLTQGIQHKLLVKLLGFDYKIEYKRGKKNKAADALSRAPNLLTCNPITVVVPKWITEVIATYINDEKCQALLAELTIDATSHPDYTLKNGIIRYKGRIVVGQDTEMKSIL